MTKGKVLFQHSSFTNKNLKSYLFKVLRNKKVSKKVINKQNQKNTI